MILDQLKKLRLADFFTLCGLASSVSAIFLLTQGNSKEHIFTAFLLIVLQISCDVIDGRVARALPQHQSQLGFFLDSFADLITILATFMLGVASGITHPLRFLVGILFILAAAIRLAYFSSEKGAVAGYFSGVPTTATSLILSTLVLLNFQFSLFPKNFLLWGYVIFGMLMISAVRIRKW